jgi:hypothetical protein
MLCLLAALRTDRGPRRDEAVISAIAIVGRGMLLLLIAHLNLQAASWPPWAYHPIMAALALVFAWQATTMFQRARAKAWFSAPRAQRGTMTSSSMIATTTTGTRRSTKASITITASNISAHIRMATDIAWNELGVTTRRQRAMPQHDMRGLPMDSA